MEFFVCFLIWISREIYIFQSTFIDIKIFYIQLHATQLIEPYLGSTHGCCLISSNPPGWHHYMSLNCDLCIVHVYSYRYDTRKDKRHGQCKDNNLKTYSGAILEGWRR